MKFDNMKLRLQLFGLWLLKNLSVWFKLAVITLITLALTGVLSDENPLLILFGLEDVSEMGKGSSWQEILINIIVSLISLSASVYTMKFSLRRIALADIRNDTLKRALIKAGYIFNKEGHLEKIEKISNVDFNGDGKIGSESINEVVPDEGLLKGLNRSMKELVTISKIDFSNIDDDTKDKINDSVEIFKKDNTETEETLVEETKEESNSNIIEDKISNEDISSTESLTNKDKEVEDNIENDASEKIESEINTNIDIENKKENIEISCKLFTQIINWFKKINLKIKTFFINLKEKIKNKKNKDLKPENNIEKPQEVDTYEDNKNIIEDNVSEEINNIIKEEPEELDKKIESKENTEKNDIKEISTPQKVSKPLTAAERIRNRMNNI